MIGMHQWQAMVAKDLDQQAEIARLTAALADTQAKLAGAYEAAADAIVNALDMNGAQMAGRYDQNKLDFHAVRALSDPDATTALTRIKAQERAAGMREAAKYAACQFDDRGNGRSGHPSEMDWTDGYRDGTTAASRAILARADAVEGGEP